jgi:N,N'-diacetyl-8-epilegionaminate cytidylyltransferase
MGKKGLKIFGFVFARGGSKGVINKNIRIVAGKPLIYHAITTALKSSLIDQVLISSEDEQIIKEAKKAGAQFLFKRPMELAEDTTPEWLAWQHAVKTLKGRDLDFDIFVSIPATSPLRSVKDIDVCIKALMVDKKADAVISVSNARRHPSFNIVTMDKDNYVNIVFPQSQRISRRQDANALYDITTVAYAARPEFILNSKALFEGRVKAVVVPEERSLDIDTEFDLKVARLLMED